MGTNEVSLDTVSLHENVNINFNYSINNVYTLRIYNE